MLVGDPREGRGEVATSDFVPALAVGDPRECRGDVAASIANLSPLKATWIIGGTSKPAPLRHWLSGAFIVLPLYCPLFHGIPIRACPLRLLMIRWQKKVARTV